MKAITIREWYMCDEYTVKIKKSWVKSRVEIWCDDELLYRSEWGVLRNREISQHFALTDEEVERMVLPRII